MNIKEGETTSQPVPGEEDFEVLDYEWIDDGVIIVRILSGGNQYVETYEHSVTERVE